MMGALAGRVAIISGGGRGLGRSYALRFAQEGAKVVVNSVEPSPDGTNSTSSAQAVVDEITAAGGDAVAHVAALELQRYDVRVNAISPFARTRLTENVPGLGEMLQVPSDPDQFDAFHPDNVAPLAVFLASRDCRFSGQVFDVQGGSVGVYQGWTITERFTNPTTWTVDGLADALAAIPALPPAFNAR